LLDSLLQEIFLNFQMLIQMWIEMQARHWL